jgi:hypothetical protein
MPLLSRLLSISHDDAARPAFPLVRVAVRGGVEPPTFRFQEQGLPSLHGHPGRLPCSVTIRCSASTACTRVNETS